MKSSLKLLAVSAAILGLTASAHAVPTLTLSDGTVAGTVTVIDNVGTDLSPMSGVVNFSGAIGNWVVNIATGLTYPVIGSLDSPQMHLNSINVSTGAGTLTITFSADGFGPSNGGSYAAIGGVLNAGAGSTVTYNTYLGATELTSQGAFGPGAFSSEVTGGAVTGNNYTLVQKVVITHTSAGSTSIDATLRVPDSGTTSILLGSSLLALAMLGRFKKRLS